jgi:hypothetical protein
MILLLHNSQNIIYCLIGGKELPRFYDAIFSTDFKCYQKAKAEY